ncbi:hypothetical protein JXD38_06630 [candidate division WOR-3 bacterium]|nr:hypothetical protein [candidate division WOR-3 bacterium]
MLTQEQRELLERALRSDNPEDRLWALAAVARGRLPEYANVALWMLSDKAHPQGGEFTISDFAQSVLGKLLRETRGRRHIKELIAKFVEIAPSPERELAQQVLETNRRRHRRRARPAP